MNSAMVAMLATAATGPSLCTAHAARAHQRSHEGPDQWATAATARAASVSSVSDPSPATPVRVGVVGGGQLALMMGEAARELPLSLTVLAARDDDPAVRVADAVLVGSARDPEALADLARRVDVVTLDHELVDLDALAAVESSGTPVRPGAAAVRFAADKAHQRQVLGRSGLPLPRFVVVEGTRDPALSAFLAAEGGRVVVKAATGGYDGRGVYFPTSRDGALEVVAGLTGPVVVEERLALRGEAAQLVVRGVDGAHVAYPLVSTFQAEGTCIEVDFPALGVGAAEAAEAATLAERIADIVGAVGVLAVELFWTDRGWLVNEIALRPHNTGHWTIEGARTSQFANHLRAVAGLPLGPTDASARHVVMVNVLGGDEPHEPPASRPGLAVHDYAKAWRPGRKIGHVTATGAHQAATRVAAWEAARAWGSREEEPWHSSPS